MHIPKWTFKSTVDSYRSTASFNSLRLALGTTFTTPNARNVSNWFFSVAVISGWSASTGASHPSRSPATSARAWGSSVTSMS
jgi:hypothetical protein